MAGRSGFSRGRPFAPRVAAALCVVSVSAARAAPPTPVHVVIVIEENHAYGEIIGSASAPYMNSLAAAGASLTNCYAITHPSQGNYLQLFSGANQGVTDDTVPAAGTPFSTANLGAALLGAGAGFGGYSEDLPAIGSTVSNSGDYYRKHNPWVNWQAASPGTNQLPAAVNMRFTDFPADYGTLPAVSIVVPNQQNDMHDGSIAQADAWLQAHLSGYASWAATHNSLLIITWDEDDGSERNRIATILYGPMVTPGQNAAVWTLHNLLRTIEDMYGLPHSGSAGGVRPIAGVFASDPPTAVRTFQQGVAGYSVAHDTWIGQSAPTTAHGSATVIVVDGSPLSQGLVRFDDIVGGSASQIPPQATVLSAKLMILTGPSAGTGDSSGNTMSAHRMKVAWSETSTWNSLVSGVGVDDVEAAAAAEFSLLPNALDTWNVFDVTGTVQDITNGAASNFGWLLNPSGTDGWRWPSSETGAVGDRPFLSVTVDLASCRANILQPPTDAHVVAGQPLMLSVSASATTPLTYQWRRGGMPLSDGGNVSGANTATLTIDPAGGADSGSYDVIVSSNCGPVTSSAAAATVCLGPATGDMNASGATDGLDVGPFVASVAAGSTLASDVCAGDFNGNARMDAGDVPGMVAALLGS